MNIGIELAKASFFTADAVLKRIDAAELRVAKRQGAYVRSVARNSMRRRRTPSRPGQPPNVVLGLLKKHIYYVWDDAQRTMLVGPAAFSQQTGTPHTLEFGGTIESGSAKHRITAEVEARPYMGPALTKSMPAFPGMWADAIAKVR